RNTIARTIADAELGGHGVGGKAGTIADHVGCGVVDTVGVEDPHPERGEPGSPGILAVERAQAPQRLAADLEAGPRPDRQPDRAACLAASVSLAIGELVRRGDRQIDDAPAPPKEQAERLGIGEERPTAIKGPASYRVLYLAGDRQAAVAVERREA